MSHFTRKSSSSSSLTQRVNIIPIGLKNGVNLSYTVPNSEVFVAGTLEVYLSGIKLMGDQLDPERDYDEAIDGTGFTLLLDPNKYWRLNRAPCPMEALTINYMIQGGNISSCRS